MGVTEAINTSITNPDGSTTTRTTYQTTDLGAPATGTMLGIGAGVASIFILPYVIVGGIAVLIIYSLKK